MEWATVTKRRAASALPGTMKTIADGERWAMPATIEDPKVLKEIGGALKEKRGCEITPLIRAARTAYA
jgi:propionyl-CoA synthetase